jgi:hypothetical protein
MSSRHFLSFLTLFALLLPAASAPPAWWTTGNPPIITGSEVNNKGPANIGQAKWMVSEALRALDTAAPAIATQIRADLAGTAPAFTDRILDLTVPSPKTADWIEKQKAPLLVGQLKAIAAPFYNRLHALHPTWLATERTTNATNQPDSIFPWTTTPADDANQAPTTLGQLKAVFSLRFETLPPPNPDLDGDGMPNDWEIANGLDPLINDAAQDTDGDGITNLQEFQNGTNPQVANTAVDSDSDSDGLLDAKDADPNDSVIDWAPAVEASYAVIEMEQFDFAEYTFQPLFDPLKYWYPTRASIGKRGTVLWEYLVKSNKPNIEWEWRYRVWKNGAWTSDITSQSTNFTSINMTRDHECKIDMWSPSTMTKNNAIVECKYSTPQVVCGDFILGLGSYYTIQPHSCNSYNGLYIGADNVATLWTLGVGSITANPIDPPSNCKFMDFYYFGGSAPLMGVMNYRAVASPGGACAILGTQTAIHVGLWKIWDSPANGGPAVPGQGSPTVIRAGALPYDDMLRIRAIEDGGVAVGERYGRNVDGKPTQQVANDHGSESVLPGSEGATHSALAICRVPTGVSGQSRLVAAGTDLWVQKNGQWKTANYKPSTNTIVAVAKNGVLLGTQAIWRNGKEISLDTLVANQKVSGPGTSARYTNLVGYAMNGEGAIVALADDAKHSGPGKKTLLTLLPAEVAVDADRDGEITFGKKDKTTTEKPYRFWINDDDDDVDGTGGTRDHVPIAEPDHQNNSIDYIRDLEDLARLAFDVNCFWPQIKSGEIKLGFKWSDTSEGNPSINIFRQVDQSGKAAQYFVSESEAIAQSSYSIFGETDASKIITVSGTASTYFPQSFIDKLPLVAAPTYLLFEGAAKGKGKLNLVLKVNGKEVVCDGPWIKLMDVRQFYSRGRTNLSATQISDPWTTPNPPTIISVPDNVPEFVADPDETQQCIIHVHGWRMTEGESRSWSEMTFKRLWQLHYKGRFATFRWATFSDDTHPNTSRLTYNRSEYRSWLCGPALSQFVNGLPYPEQRYLIAHSMGNVISGRALQVGMKVNRYVMCNAAMAAMSYDGSITNLPLSLSDTPDTDSDPATKAFGLKNRFNDALTTRINYYLPKDEALASWVLNQEVNKPEWFIGSRYVYDQAETPGNKIYYKSGGIFPTRSNVTLAEAFGHVVRSRSDAVGAVGNANGSISSKVGMDGFGFGSEHNAEWNWSLTTGYKFWRKLFDSFDIPTTAPKK